MLIGVYSHEHPFEVLNQYRLESYLKKAFEQNVELCFFGIEDVDFESNKILGDYYENGHWVKKESGFPLVAINEFNQGINKLRYPDKELKLQAEISFTSHLINNKYEMYCKIKEANLLSHLLIPTKRLRLLSDFYKMMKENKKLVLKPDNEAKGNGILVVTKNRSNYSLQEKTITYHLNLKDINKIILNLIEKGNYIIQPFIKSSTNDGKTFHVRVHLIRNANAQWIILKVIADIAEQGIDISNYEGVTTIEGNEFLCENYGKENRDELFKNLQNLAYQFTEHIDSFYPYSLDELAIDFAIDQKGKIWFFEGNTEPEIIFFKEEREIERAYHIVGYSKRIAQLLTEYPDPTRKGKYFKIKHRK